MKLSLSATAVLLAIGAVAAGPAWACGFGEAPGDCGQTAEADARYLLKRSEIALGKDPSKALRQFQRGEGGFRTQDSYVFCVGVADGVMNAHPSPLLQGHDVRDLHDSTGNYFIAAMLKTAEQGKVSEIHYLFPRPGSTEAVPKTTFYTRAADQVCGVGVYEGDDAPVQSRLSRRDRMAQLRSKLEAALPPSLRPDWAAYQDALSEQVGTTEAAIDKAREQIQAANVALAASR